MSLCRAASQALAFRLSRAPAAAGRLKQRAPLRQMSSGSVPGSSGENMIIYLLAGAAAFGGLFYAYRLVSSSRSRFIDHMNVLHERAEGRKGNPWSRKEGDEETDEVTEAEKATEEADAADAAGPAAQDESAGPAAQDESSGESPEAGGENDLLAPEASPAVEEAQQEATANSEAAANLEVAANSEAAAVQESVSEVLDVAASPALEENLDSGQEGVASAAQELSDTASESQDADAEESWQTAEVSEEEKAPEESAKDS
ncbi:protein MGARP isoform X1 [Myiozetetes cayanensis]|uniref:protein MGARP isoform X1 n=1 Tax=Myiozetetes cayanensis TaxID=478635 RepID=UPI00215F72DC|nr:protein MGARP isoform X1 [Myiozetetes cayanensis]XP_050176477.1 protein MGARP isoform X1 [Myiozetetes cayanensis]